MHTAHHDPQPRELTWDEMQAVEPALAELIDDARMAPIGTGDESWRVYEGFKTRLKALVGYNAADFRLRSPHMYEVANRILVEILGV